MMTQTAADSTPLPADAHPDAEVHGQWEAWGNNLSRIVGTPVRSLIAHNRDAGRVFGSAIQNHDGSIDNGDQEPPLVYIETIGTAEGITTTDARQIAAAILATADLLDAWVSG